MYGFVEAEKGRRAAGRCGISGNRICKIGISGEFSVYGAESSGRIEGDCVPEICTGAREIAMVTEQPMRTVQSRLRRALKMMKCEMEGEV